MNLEQLTAKKAYWGFLQGADSERYVLLSEDAAVTPKTEAELKRQQAKWDKLAAKRAVKTGSLPTGWRWCACECCHHPFRPARKSTIHCSPRCKRRWEQNQPRTAA